MSDNLDRKLQQGAPKQNLREILFITEQAKEGEVKVLPGKEWSVHYPGGAKTRQAKLKDLFEGRCSAKDTAADLKPDAILFDVSDIDAVGLERVSARVRDTSAFISHYDYPRFATFVESMKGRNVPLEAVEGLYNGIARTRVQKKLLDAYGSTGRQQIEQALVLEAERIKKSFASSSRLERVLSVLKMDWLGEKMNLISRADRDQLIAEMSGEERKTLEKLREAYRDYVHGGDEKQYERLVRRIKDELPSIAKEPPKKEPKEDSESMKKLDEELKQFADKAGMPGTPDDPGIPPDDSDEYHTPPPGPEGAGSEREKKEQRPIFEITPPLAGSYAGGRKSYYDIDKKTWSKRKKLSTYSENPTFKTPRKISGNLETGLKSLPLPNGYTINASSLQFTGAKPELHRDQNGCFYVKASGTGTFSVEFGEDPKPHETLPIAEDTAAVYRGRLSDKTESATASLVGSSIQKAESARQHILANHFYPGGGDLKKAQALQYKLRTQSTGDNYVQNLDSSEYLECYSANTLFIAMMRRAGVPARLVVGHHVKGAKKGKSVIDESTGHAWAEIWDGNRWRRFDATPQPKPEDKKKKEDDKKDPAEEAEDGGIDSPDAGDKQTDEGDQKNGKPGKPSTEQSKNPLDQISQTSEEEMKDAESESKEAQQQMDQMQKKQSELSEAVQKAEKFKDIADMKKELEKSDLLEDMKTELEEKLEAKEKEMKEQIKEELDKMVEDGFMDQERRDELVKQMERQDLEQMDRMQQQIEEENRLYAEYEKIREEVMPLVEEWYKFFVEKLPRENLPEIDEDTRTRQGFFDRRAILKPRNLIFHTIKNPRVIRPSVKPRFLASILIDVSGSMAGEKLRSARKLLVFYCELFSRISQEFGYIRFSIDLFSDWMTQVKAFGQDYDSAERYFFPGGQRSTVKMRLMKSMQVSGGTNMLDAIRKVSGDLNQESFEYPDYASAMYFTGDGGDTCGNAANIKRFLQTNDKERGFGHHMYSATLLGNASQKKALSDIFGEDHTNVAPDFDTLIENSMTKFDEDMEFYLRDKIA